MKKINIIHYITLFIAILFTGCDSLVDVEPKGFIIPSTAADLRMMLNNTSGNYTKPRPVTIGYSLIQYAGDQTYYTDEAKIESKDEDVYSYYTRNKQLIEEHNHGDILYLYELVALSNAVLDILPTTNDLSEIERDQIKGEALVHRAYAFLAMVNIHGRHYDVTASATDPGIPMPLKHDIINMEIPARSTVAEVYKQIVDDLKEAINLLGNIQTNRALPCNASANALLARTYLFMGNFELAFSHANEALKGSNYLYNLEDYIDSEGDLAYPNRDYKCKEIFLFKEVDNSLGANASRYVSPEFYALYEEGDLRKEYYNEDKKDTTKHSYTNYPYTFSGILISEMYLVRAECNARDNKLQLALDDLNYIRSHRIKAENYTALASEDKNEVMDWVLRERQIELAWVGLRWFDMKRLNKDEDPRYHITLTRTFKGETDVYEPNSDMWVFPFPGNMLEKGIVEQNQ